MMDVLTPNILRLVAQNQGHGFVLLFFTVEVKKSRSNFGINRESAPQKVRLFSEQISSPW